MVNSQMDLLEFLYDNQSTLPFKSRKLFQAYCEIKNYTGNQGNFTELLSKLHEKGLVEKPSYGVYDISEHGVQKVETLRGLQEKGVELPEEYGEIVEELTFFFMDEMEEEIAQARVKGKKLKVRISDLDKFNSSLIEFFRDNPSDFITAFEEALDDYVAGKAPDYKLVPDVDWLETPLEEAKNSAGVGTPVSVTGIIRKSESVMPMITDVLFECSQCGDRYDVNLENSSKVKSPYKCDCGSRQFHEVEKSYIDVIDFQLSQRDKKETKMDARITGSLGKEEQNELMTGSKIKLLAVIEQSGPGDKKDKKVPTRLNVLSYQKMDKKKEIEEIDDEKKEKVMEKVRKADDPFDDLVVPSIAPGLGNLDLPKKCIAVSLWGSPEIDDEGVGSKDYGRIHSGIIANPGLGKSEMLNWVQSNISKTFQAQGKSGTGTGLTATAEQVSGGEWRLVAGKLVFADKGILQIDEFDKFPEGELAALNTAMESGFFEVDKASVSAELPGRATIIAAGNFQGKLDQHTHPYELLPEKGEGLYDRFALMCAITDSGDEAHDSIKGRFTDETGLEDDGPPLDVEELRIYRHISQQHDPRLTDESWDVIKSFVDAANSKSGGELRGESNRFLVNLIKIALAIARFNFRDDVATEEDAEKACELMREARESMGLDMGDSSVGVELQESNREQKILDIYEEVSDEDGRVNITDLEEEVTDRTKMSEKVFKQVLDRLKNDGRFFKPARGVIKAI